MGYDSGRSCENQIAGFFLSVMFCKAARLMRVVDPVANMMSHSARLPTRFR